VHRRDLARSKAYCRKLPVCRAFAGTSPRHRLSNGRLAGRKPINFETAPFNHSGTPPGTAGPDPSQGESASTVLTVHRARGRPEHATSSSWRGSLRLLGRDPAHLPGSPISAHRASAFCVNAALCARHSSRRRSAVSSLGDRNLDEQANRETGKAQRSAEIASGRRGDWAGPLPIGVKPGR
jgi:hypothetical protein